MRLGYPVLICWSAAVCITAAAMISWLLTSDLNHPKDVCSYVQMPGNWDVLSSGRNGDCYVEPIITLFWLIQGSVIVFLIVVFGFTAFEIVREQFPQRKKTPNPSGEHNRRRRVKNYFFISILAQSVIVTDVIIHSELAGSDGIALTIGWFIFTFPVVAAIGELGRAVRIVIPKECDATKD